MSSQPSQNQTSHNFSSSENIQRMIIPVPKNTGMLYAWSIAIAVGSFVMGYFFVIVSVLTSTMTNYMNQQSDDGKQQNTSIYLSACTAFMPIGGLLGSLLYSRLINKVQSEHKLDKLCDIIMIVALLLQLFTLNIYAYTFIRFIEGFITGIYGIIIPQYLISISPTQISGRIGSLNQIMITIGIAVAYGLGYLIDQDDLSNSFNWRFISFFPVPFILLKRLVCNTFPYDMIQRHIQRRDWKSIFQYIQMFYENGTLSLEDLIKSKNFDLSKIKQQIPKSKNQLKNTKQIPIDLLSKQSTTIQSKSQPKQKKTSGLETRQLLSIAISILNQFCGINAILFYSNQLFLDISHGDIDYAVRKSLELGLFQILVTIISGGIMDRFGRRTLMIGGEIMIILALASGYYMIDYDHQSKWDPQYVTYAIFLHMAGFSLSLGPITVIYISEIIQDISPYMTFIWVETIFISLVSNIMIEKFGTGKVFLFFALVSCMGLLYLFKYMLETKGKTRQAVVQSFDQIHSQGCLSLGEPKQYNQVAQSQN